VGGKNEYYGEKLAKISDTIQTTTFSLKNGDNIYIKNGQGLVLKGKTVYKNLCSVSECSYKRTGDCEIEPIEPGIYTFSCLAEVDNPNNVCIIWFLDTSGKDIY
jgi:hypothetical protein